MSGVYKCKKCGIEMTSKCRRQRSEFIQVPESYNDTDGAKALRKMLKYDESKKNHDMTFSAELMLDRFPPIDLSKDNGDTYLRLLISDYMVETFNGDIAKILRALAEAVTEQDELGLLDYSVCKHEWECTHECLFGCCKPETK